MSALQYHKLNGYKYAVAEDTVIFAPEFAGVSVRHEWFTIQDSRILALKGYKWDGASGPTIDTPATMLAALAHDVAYQAIRAGLISPEYRATADMMFYRIMRSHPSKWRAWAEVRAFYYFSAVRLFGHSATKRRAIEPQDRVFAV
jgi:hypothetical protein